MKDKVMPYTQAEYDSDSEKLIKLLKDNAPKEQINSSVYKIKRKYLIPQLKNYFLALTYALNAKNENLRIFINPNVARLHDFDGTKDKTRWNFCGEPAEGKYPGYYLQGGLSRLNFALGTVWQKHIFRNRQIYDLNHISAFIQNNLDLYPIPRVSKSLNYTGLLVEFGLELIRKARLDENLKQDIIDELSFITTGYFYRNIVEYFSNHTEDYFLFINEIMELGERFFLKQKHLDKFSSRENLLSFTQAPLSDIVEKEVSNFGNIYYYSFGSLIPRKIDIFPQGVTDILNSGGSSGEMVNELKIKMAYLMYKQNLNPVLLGYLILQYLENDCRQIYAQNHKKDYFNIYFLGSILNNSHLNSLLKNAQSQGILRLK